MFPELTYKALFSIILLENGSKCIEDIYLIQKCNNTPENKIYCQKRTFLLSVLCVCDLCQVSIFFFQDVPICSFSWVSDAAVGMFLSKAKHQFAA